MGRGASRLRRQALELRSAAGLTDRNGSESSIASKTRAPRLLASVATLAEVDLALAAGADLIDLKDPEAGALGAWPRAH